MKNFLLSFVDYTRSLLGEEEYEKLAVALQQEPPVSIRFNNEKWKMQDEGLSAVHSPFDRVPWSSEGVYLDERLTFTFDPLFHAGLFLCSGGLLDVCRAGITPIHQRTGNNVGSLRRSRWKVYPCP